MTHTNSIIDYIMENNMIGYASETAPSAKKDSESSEKLNDQQKAEALLAPLKDGSYKVGSYLAKIEYGTIVIKDNPHPPCKYSQGMNVDDLRSLINLVDLQEIVSEAKEANSNLFWEVNTMKEVLEKS